MRNRRLTILVREHGWLCTTEYQTPLGYWKTLSTAWVETEFPLYLVGRVAARADYIIRIHV